MWAKTKDIIFSRCHFIMSPFVKLLFITIQRLGTLISKKYIYSYT